MVIECQYVAKTLCHFLHLSEAGHTDWAHASTTKDSAVNLCAKYGILRGLSA